jgi:exodeoxyribonuclease VII large subunit
VPPPVNRPAPGAEAAVASVQGAASAPAARSVQPAPPARSAAGSPQRRALAVRELVARIQEALQRGFPRGFWVEGEVSNFKVSRGHAFFCLKDDEAQVEALMWSSSLAALRFTPSDGMHVLAFVRKVDLWAPNGRLRVHVERVEPQGAGALARALEELTRRLRAEGLFDPARKRALPLLPATVGIATASTGAAVHDMVRVLQQRFAERRIVIRPCKVQGDGAAADVAAAIDDLNRLGGVDVIIVGRGGGSAEDLWAFNEEVVVRAIARSRVPVVSAVGHETDNTLSDHVADLRVPTPTAAAQRVMPERRALEEQLVRLRVRLREALARRVELARTRLETREARLGDPRRRVAELRLHADRMMGRAGESLRTRVPRLSAGVAQLASRLGQAAPATPRLHGDLERLASRLAAAAARPIERRGRDLAEASARLDALSPLAVLARGFALARRADGSIVRDAAVLSPGETIDVRFARGAARAGVLEIKMEDDGDVVATRAPRRGPGA